MRSQDVLDDFIAGWASGVVGLLVSHPFDTLKVRLQSLHTYRGVFQCITQTVRHESIGGFYKGMAVPLLTSGFLHSTFFLGYSATVSALESASGSSAGVGNQLEQRKERSLGKLIVASVAGASLQWIPSCPIEVIKTRLQVQRENVGHLRRLQRQARALLVGETGLVLMGSIDCARQIWRYGGLAGLYRGGMTMLIRDCVGFCFYLPVYEITLRQLSPSPNHDSRRVWAAMLAGGVAGVTCWWSILPLDVIKSRLQSDHLVKPKYKGMRHCAADTYRKEGWRAFTKAWQVAAMRGFPACACMFLVYEQTRHLLTYGEQMWQANVAQ